MSDTVVKKIKLKNYKCHLLIEEEMKQITILAGENAAGKSSFIQSILLYDLAAKSKENNIFTFNVHGVNLGTAPSILSENADSDQVEISLEVNEKIGDMRLTPVENEDTFFRVTKNGESDFHFQLFYLNAERIGPRMYNEIGSDGVFYVGVHGQNSIYVMNQLDQILRTSQYKNIISLDVFKQFADEETSRFSVVCEKYLKEIIPGTSLNAQSHTEYGTSTIRFTNYSGREVIPTATGFGITYVLPIIVQALISLLFPDSVLVVENPEAHLHPYSQSMIGKFLAKIAAAGSQVIVETHSEHFINGCRLELANCNHCDIAKILFFSREEDSSEPKCESITVEETGELSKWPKGFFDQNERDLMEILKKKYADS